MNDEQRLEESKRLIKEAKTYIRLSMVIIGIGVIVTVVTFLNIIKIFG